MADHVISSLRAGHYEEQPEGFRAFLPADLPPDPPVVWSESLSTRLEDASLALGRLDGIIQTLPNPDRFVMMYVRREAVLSSQIEGTQSSLLDLLAAEARISMPDTPQDVSEVLNYVRSLNHGLGALDSREISVPLLRELHGILLRETRGSELSPGKLRDQQVWIGARHTPIAQASFVPPPARAVARSLDSLVEYINLSKDLPVLIWIGLVHVQFETIHPFFDGNGRLGRLLITLLLQREGKLKHPVLYLSHYFKRRRPEYYAHLQDVRDTGSWENWLAFHLDGIADVARRAVRDAQAILELREEHRETMARELAHQSGIGYVLLDNLFERPVVTIRDVMRMLEVSYDVSRRLILKVASLGILVEIGGRKRNKAWLYRDYFNLISV